jgi:hypothetical protein
MATIKFRRGSGQPTGLTAFEPAWDTTNNRLFVNNGSTALWVGAAIDNSPTLAGNCAFTIPTQNAVKTYVDNSVSAGAVATVNGVTGAVTIGGGTAIAIATSTAARGITVTNTGVWSVNGTTGAVTNIAVTNAAQSFTGLQSFIDGLCAASGITLTNTAGTRTHISQQGIRGAGFKIRNQVSFGMGQGDANEFDIGASGDNITIAPTTSIVTIDTGLASKTVDYQTGIRFLGYNNGLAIPYNTLLRLGVGMGNTLSLPSSSGTLALLSEVGVTSVDGVTGAVDLLAGSGISITNPTGTAKGITLANTGVLSIASGNTAISFNASTGAVTGTFNGVHTIASGNTAISFNTTTGSVTGTFNGVHTVAGTANQITASSSTGSVTLSLPSAVTMPGSLTVTGDLTVNGTTTTVNSTTVTVQDPLIAIGGLTGNIPPVSGDVKDRGILFQHFATVGRTGFFGHDTSTGRFTYLPRGVVVSGEVVSGTAGIAEFAGVIAPQANLRLAAPNPDLPNDGAGVAAITLDCTSQYFPSISYSGITHTFASVFSDPVAKIRLGSFGATNASLITSNSTVANRAFTLPDIAGTAIVADTGGATSGWILIGTGTSTANTWINPATSGFTAFAATNADLLRLTGTAANTNFNITFASGNSGYQIHYADLSNNLTWNPSTQTLTAASGLGKFEGVVDGGGF